MLRKGYIQQQIEALAITLARVLRLREAGNQTGALAELKIAFRGLTGLDAETVAALPEQGILDLLRGEGRLDAGRCLTLAGLLREQAEIEEALGRAARAHESFRKALSLLLEALLHEPTLRQPEQRAQVNGLRARVAAGGAPAPPLLLRLFRYHEVVGEYRLASEALDGLRARGIGGVAGESDAFYRRLLDLPEARLEAGGLSRAEVGARLAGAAAEQ